MDSTISPSTQPLYRGTQVVWYIFGVLEALLAFRLFLKLLGANPQAGFSDFIYTITLPFVGPFQSVFQRTITEGSVIEWTTILAMLVYWIIAEAIIRLFLMGKSVSTSEASRKLNEQES